MGVLGEFQVELWKPLEEISGETTGENPWETARAILQILFEEISGRSEVASKNLQKWSVELALSQNTQKYNKKMTQQKRLESYPGKH